MIALWINIAIAIIWLMLNKTPGISDFFVGYAAGFLLILACSRLIGDINYIRRVKGFFLFTCRFLWEFLKSNLAVAYVILFKKASAIKPGYFHYDIEGLTWLESILLSYCITLTPGTISVKLSPEEKTLVVHSLDCEDTDAIKSFLDETFKHSILRFTR